MKKNLHTLIAIAALLAPPVQAAIPVGPTGVGPLTFDTPPIVSEWSSLSVLPSSAGNITNAAALDIAVQTNLASTITTVLPWTSTLPPSTSGDSRWNSNAAALFLQARPTGNSYTLLMATLQNNAGSPVSDIAVSYLLNALTSSDSTINESIYGFRVYWSRTGAANSWKVIPNISAGSTALAAYPANMTASINFVTNGGTWGVGAPLYLLWADDNGPSSDAAPSKEGAYTIDDFSVVPTLTNEPANIFIVSPTNNAVYPQSKVLTVTTEVRGSIASVDFFVDGGVVQTIDVPPFNAAIDTTSLTPGTYTLRAQGQVSGGGTVTTTNQNFIILANQPPTIAITNISSGSVTGTTFLVGSPVTVQARVSDDVAVTNIEWYVDNALYVNRASNSPTFIIIDTLVGSHTIYGVAVDNSGGTTTSPIETITITNPAPQVTLLISNGSEWSYYNTNISITPEGATVFPPPPKFGTWTEAFYDVSDWTPLFAEIGGGDTAEYPEKSVVDIGPTGNRYLAHYMRKSFFVPGDAAYDNLQIRLLRDDGAIVFLNGIPVWTNNMVTAALDVNYPTPPPWVFAYNNVGTNSDDGVNFQVLNIIGAANIFDNNLLIRGQDNIVAVEVHQQNPTSSDFSFDLMLWGESAPPLPPVITITTPTNNQNYFVGDAVAVTATASTIFVTNVTFHLDGVPQATDGTPPSPFTGTIPSVPLGQHQITAVGQDTLGNVVTSDPITIIVNADQPPAVAISAVYNAGVTGSVFLVGSAVTNAVTATDALGVTNVAFYLNGRFRSQDTTSPYGPFIVGDALAGTNVFTAVATDNKGQTNFATVLVTITNPPYALILTNGSTWKYDDTGVAPPADWMQLAFDDLSWSNGVAELGFGDIDAFNPEQTVIRRTNELLGVATTNFYYRKTFTVANPAAYNNLIVSLLRDDGGQVYLNGTLVFTSPANFPSTTATPDDGSIYHRTNVAPASLVAGPNIVAVHVAQNNTTSSDTSFDLMLWGQTGTISVPSPHIVNNGTQIVITWTGSAVLQQAVAVTGPFVDVPGNPGSGYTIPLPAPGNAQFYRLRAP